MPGRLSEKVERRGEAKLRQDAYGSRRAADIVAGKVLAAARVTVVRREPGCHPRVVVWEVTLSSDLSVRLSRP